MNENNTSPDSLIRYCMQPPPDKVLSQEPYGNVVVKLTAHIVIKLGVGVNQTEARNQRLAFALVDRSIVRIPAVHCYFAYAGIGYIVMEYLSDPNYRQMISSIANILTHLASFIRDVPGPLDFGCVQGLLFEPDDSADVFPSMSSLEEEWWCQKLSRDDARIRIRDLPAVLCHLDVAPRNLLWPPGQPPVLLDWSSAGCYPQVFELCALWIMEGKEGTFTEDLIIAMKDVGI